MAGKLEGKTIAFLATEGVEQVELTEPWKAVEDAGGTAELISLEAGEVQAFNHLDKADTFPVDHTAADADASRYDGLVLPGGVANPDFLRADEDAVAFVRAFFEQAKPVAAICHGPWTLIEAGVVRGRTVTSWPSLQTDLRNAGANWVDEEVLRRPGPRDLAQPRRPAGLLRQARRGVLPRASTRASASARGARRDAPARRDPRRRRHARRHELPPRARVVPGVPPARRDAAALPHPPAHRAWAATSSSPPSPARSSSASTATTCARPRASCYMELIDEVRAAAGRARAARDLKRARATPIVLASSAKPHEVEHYLDLLDARELADGWTTSADVEQTKPEPDLVAGGDREGRRRRRR